MTLAGESRNCGLQEKAGNDLLVKCQSKKWWTLQENENKSGSDSGFNIQ